MILSLNVLYEYHLCEGYKLNEDTSCIERGYVYKRKQKAYCPASS